MPHQPFNPSVEARAHSDKKRLGWGTLVLAGGGAYYFAKREINAERRQQHLALQQRQRITPSYTLATAMEGTDKGTGEQSALYEQEFGNKRDPAIEASQVPAPTRHEPQTADQRVREKSKYVASEVYRSPKGDRFS